MLTRNNRLWWYTPHPNPIKIKIKIKIKTTRDNHTSNVPRHKNRGGETQVPMCFAATRLVGCLVLGFLSALRSTLWLAQTHFTQRQ